jgi:regulator of protease activity HflC (stomatin/prohibitin superfamily)
MVTLSSPLRSAAGPGGGFDGTLAWAVIVGLLLLCALPQALRVIPAHERAVVLRFGRIVRSRGPGLRLVIPGAERMVRVSLRPSRLEPLVVRATTRDEVRVCLHAAARFRVVDPVRWTVEVTDAYTRTAEAIEVAVRADIDGAELRELTRFPAGRQARLLHEVNAVVAEWGAEVTDIDVIHIDLSLNAQLLQWAERLPRDLEKEA